MALHMLTPSPKAIRMMNLEMLYWQPSSVRHARRAYALDHEGYTTIIDGELVTVRRVETKT